MVQETITKRMVSRSSHFVSPRSTPNNQGNFARWYQWAGLRRARLTDAILRFVSSLRKQKNNPTLEWHWMTYRKCFPWLSVEESGKDCCCWILVPSPRAKNHRLVARDSIDLPQDSICLRTFFGSIQRKIQERLLSCADVPRVRNQRN